MCGWQPSLSCEGHLPPHHGTTSALDHLFAYPPRWGEKRAMYGPHQLYGRRLEEEEGRHYYMSRTSCEPTGEFPGRTLVCDYLERSPELNVCCASHVLMFVLENCLRELIVDELSELCGQLWWKSCLTGTALAKFKQARELEKSTPWSTLVSHHPVYYLDFPDLRETIIQNKNWTEAFSPIFHNKDNTSRDLSSIEPIRNKIAHNRHISESDMSRLVAVSADMEACVHRDRYVTLGLRCTQEVAIPQRLSGLRGLIQCAHKDMSSCQVLTPESLPLVTWEVPWWLDGDYLGSPVNSVEPFIAIVRGYAALSRYRGCGPQIEAWLNKENMESIFKLADSQIETCMEEGSGG